MLYSWVFIDKKDRWRFWYTLAFSLVIGLVIWWIFTGQYWMSFMVLLLSWLMFYIENNSKDEIEVQITELGIKIDDTFYDFSKIQSYTFIYEWEHAILLRLNLLKRGINLLDIHIDNSVASELKEILPQFILENPQEDLNFIDKLIRILKL